MENNVINNMYDFMIIFDAKNSNPNGDPDKNNMPRQNDDTGKGIITDACIKRKIRNYIEVYNETLPENEKQAIFINMNDLLNNRIAESVDTVEKEMDETPNLKNLKESDKERLRRQQATSLICKSYYDVRTFGAVLSTGNTTDNTDTVEDNTDTDTKNKNKNKNKNKKKSANNVRGPVQISMATSVDVINPIELSITRQAVTNEKDKDKWENGNGTFGSKWIIPYGLYVATGNVSPFLADKTGFTEKDLELLWQSFVHMFDFDKSASRPEMCVRKLIIFKHDSKLGNAPSHRLFESVHIDKKDRVEVPDSFKDYVINIDNTNIPDTVTVIEM